MANIWTKEQLSAIEKRNSNILVSASAGSGKTTVLVERVIRRVIEEGINIDEILVLTFTNAAAVELKEKILKAIYSALEARPNDLFLKQQLLYIHRASITTIHAFCLDLIRQNFHILNIDPNFKIADESQITILKNKVMEEVIEQEYEKANEDPEQNKRLYKLLELFYGKDENLIECLFNIYSYVQSFSYPFAFLKEKIEEYHIPETQDLYHTRFGKEIYDGAILELESIIRRGKKIYEELEQEEDFSKHSACLEQDLKKLENVLSSCQYSWDHLYEALSTLDFPNSPRYTGENLDLKEKFASFRKDILKGTIKKLNKSIYANSKTILKDNEVAYDYVCYLEELLEEFEKRYRLEKNKQSLLDFSDIEHLALALLVDEKEGKITEIARSLQEKFQEIYTDEYQDTSFVQEAILESISRGNNRFMVGDIKQSIYRFRQAMPEIFNEKYHAYPLADLEHLNEEEQKEVKIILAQNFRSRENVIHSINFIFERIMSTEMGECDYSDLELLKFGASAYPTLEGQNYKTELNIIDLKKEEERLLGIESNESAEMDESMQYIEDLKNFEIEAIYIGNKIQKLIQEFQIYDMKEKKFRKCQYQDIVILVRGIKDKGTILESTLKKMDIPAFSDASSSLFDGDEIKLVMSFLKVLDNPYQDIEMISIMYSILGNFTLDELVYIKKGQKKGYMYDLLRNLKQELEKEKELDLKQKQLFHKVKKFLDLLDHFSIYAKLYNVDELLIRLYQETNIYYQFALEEMSALKKANLNMLVEFARNYGLNGTKTLSSYIRYIEHLKDKSDTSSSAKIIGENENVVRIMTIHKSKGLEFPVVILADMSRKYNMMDVRDKVTLHQELGIGIHIVNEELGITYPSVIKQAIKNRLVSETKSEELRLLYVAMTRAKEKLILFATTKDYEKKYDSLYTILNEKGKIDETLTAKNNSYFENILMALKSYPKEEQEQMIDVFVTKVQTEENRKQLMEATNIELHSKKTKLLEKLNDFKTLSLDEKEKEKVKENVAMFQKNIDEPYAFLEEQNTVSRISVSALKKEDHEEEEIFVPKVILEENEEKKVEDTFKVPELLLGEKKAYTAVRKGILIHFILENLDLQKTSTKAEVKKQIETFVKQDVVHEEDAKYISITKIAHFLNSLIGNELKQAKEIYREYEFILKDKKFSRSTIQGVIDLFYIDQNGKVILVDFKTDKLDSEELFIKRYHKQLEIYKEAIEKLMGCLVEHTYIYSFHLDKEIEITEEAYGKSSL